MTAASAIYLDTSCLLKLFFPEPESAEVAAVLASEERVIVSELGRLEAETQLRARQLGGLLTKARYQRLAEGLANTLSLVPFEVLPFPDDGFSRARSLSGRARVHCRTLDLLHIAAMDAAGVELLFTNDRTQASVAKALGFEVKTPET